MAYLTVHDIRIRTLQTETPKNVIKRIQLGKSFCQTPLCLPLHNIEAFDQVKTDASCLVHLP